jgi:hypothetical protein
MKPFVWYSRYGGKGKDKHGTEKEIVQYGVSTGIKGFDLGAYLESPRTGDTEVYFANFEPDKSRPSYYNPPEFKDESEMDSYLWFLVAEKIGKKAIKRVFEEWP